MPQELAERLVVHVHLPSLRRETSIAGENRDMKAAFSLGNADPGYRPFQRRGVDQDRSARVSCNSSRPTVPVCRGAGPDAARGPDEGKRRRGETSEAGSDPPLSVARVRPE
ncbi:hypothetical protein Aab01nite_85460 [Paractinoplanes abujensis]|nr:hypothetical protein Aab01nite_85460 [Actinoplanes abujensis]